MVSGFNNGAVTVDDAATSRTNLGITNIATQTTTNHDLLIGAASNGITNVAPSATSGVPVISQGASADPAFGTAVVAGGGSGATSFTAYSVITGGTTSTGLLQNVSGVGTSGQVLTSAGASALPAWGNGGWVLIQTQGTGTGATLSFTTGITNTYDAYVFVMKNVVSASAATKLQIQVSVDGGANYIATGYLAGANVLVYNSATVTNVNQTTGFLLTANVGLTASLGVNGAIFFTGVTSGANIMLSGIITYNNATPAPVMSLVTGSLGTASINAFQFSWTAGGNFTSGNISLYGIRQ